MRPKPNNLVICYCSRCGIQVGWLRCKPVPELKEVLCLTCMTEDRRNWSESTKQNPCLLWTLPCWNWVVILWSLCLSRIALFILCYRTFGRQWAYQRSTWEGNYIMMFFVNWLIFVVTMLLSAAFVEWYYAKFKGDESLEQNKTSAILPTLSQRNEVDKNIIRKLWTWLHHHFWLSFLWEESWIFCNP